MRDARCVMLAAGRSVLVRACVPTMSSCYRRDGCSGGGGGSGELTGKLGQLAERPECSDMHMDPSMRSWMGGAGGRRLCRIGIAA
ncbi:hypothetical protein EDB80DRAFT_292398 [Ilyonectria destructans]|nr:hypothetical protein EDB80DRAFT_292398 [Ilyonectria destructans]